MEYKKHISFWLYVASGSCYLFCACKKNDTCKKKHLIYIAPKGIEGLGDAGTNQMIRMTVKNRL